MVTENLSTKLGRMRIVSLKLLSGMNMIVIVIHGAIRVIPALQYLGPIFGLIALRITFLGTAKNNQYIILTAYLYCHMRRFSINKNVTAI